MPLQNRVTPTGTIIATPARGTMYGNRGGCFHNDDKTLKPRHWASKQWICCVLDFKDRRRAMMQPGRFTELFFLDEATALAAGHRPCFECRRADATRFAEFWLAAHGGEEKSGRASAAAMDDVLHRARLRPNGQSSLWAGPVERLPDGAFIRLLGAPYLLCGPWLYPWTPAGYGAPIPKLSGPEASLIPILTPLPMIAVIERGYRPMLHPTASPI